MNFGDARQRLRPWRQLGRAGSAHCHRPAGHWGAGAVRAKRGRSDAGWNDRSDSRRHGLGRGARRCSAENGGVETDCSNVRYDAPLEFRIKEGMRILLTEGFRHLDGRTVQGVVELTQAMGGG